MIKKIALIAYYGLVKHLPTNETLFFGKISCRLRRMVTGMIFKSSGDGVNVNRNASFGSGTNLSIGSNSSIGRNCQLANDVAIGDDVMMAPDVIIFSVGHNTQSIDMPMRKQGNTLPQPVKIENDVWIGQRVIILPGITIGRGSIIGSGSVVTKDIPAFSVAAGNPAKIIKSRLK